MNNVLNQVCCWPVNPCHACRPEPPTSAVFYQLLSTCGCHRGRVEGAEWLGTVRVHDTPVARRLVHGTRPLYPCMRPRGIRLLSSHWFALAELSRKLHAVWCDAGLPQCRGSGCLHRRSRRWRCRHARFSVQHPGRNFPRVTVFFTRFLSITTHYLRSLAVHTIKHFWMRSSTRYDRMCHLVHFSSCDARASAAAQARICSGGCEAVKGRLPA